MVGLSILGLIMLLFLSGSVTMGIVLLVRGTRRPEREHPACGKCGYDVSGNPSLTCPECGSDLRLVGILTPAARRKIGRAGPVVWITLWTLLLPWPMLMLGALFSQFIAPYVYETNQQRVIFCQDPFLSTTITAKQTGSEVHWGGMKFNHNAAVTRMDIDFPGPNGNAIMHVNLITRGYDYTIKGAPHSGRVSTFGTDAMLDCFESAGFDTKDSRVQQSAADVIKCIDEIPTAAGKFTRLGGAPRVTGITAHPTWNYTTSHLHPGAGYGMLAGSVFIWLAGIGLILRRNANRRAAVAVPVAA